MKTLYKLALLFCLVITTLFIPSGFFRLIILVFVLIETIIFFKISIISSDLSDTLKNVITVCITLFIVLIILETGFMFVKQSNPTQIPLSSKNWLKNTIIQE